MVFRCSWKCCVWVCVYFVCQCEGWRGWRGCQRTGSPSRPTAGSSPGQSAAGTLMWARALTSSSPITRSVAGGAACCVKHILVTAHNWWLRLHATNTLQPFSCKLRNVKNTVNNQSGREPTGLDWAPPQKKIFYNCKLDYYLAFSTSKACVSITCMCACQAQYIIAIYTHAAVKRHHVIPDTWLQTWQAMAEDWCFSLSTR